MLNDEFLRCMFRLEQDYWTCSSWSFWGPAGNIDENSGQQRRRSRTVRVAGFVSDDIRDSSSHRR
ncbi:uncharacterized protein J3R85_015295 [Psidium guajava]|nr:uncharacterized protein J3R85_015295 [Psidium guajava]